MNTAQLAYTPFSRHTVSHFYNMGYACQHGVCTLYNFSPLGNEIYFHANIVPIVLAMQILHPAQFTEQILADYQRPKLNKLNGRPPHCSNVSYVM